MKQQCLVLDSSNNFNIALDVGGGGVLQRWTPQAFMAHVNAQIKKWKPHILKDNYPVYKYRKHYCYLLLCLWNMTSYLTIEVRWAPQFCKHYVRVHTSHWQNILSCHVLLIPTLFITGLIICEDLSNVLEPSALCDFKADCVNGSDERDCGEYIWSLSFGCLSFTRDNYPVNGISDWL